jgi:ParB-like chromosome segregation protein Spo0J
MKKATRSKNGTSPKIVRVRIADIKPATVNNHVYGTIDPSDPALDELVQSMKVQGQLEEVVLTLDNVLLSGHRRRSAAIRLKWKTLRARRENLHSSDPRFEQLLVSFNAQRDKAPDVRVREQLTLTDPENAY